MIPTDEPLHDDPPRDPQLAAALRRAEVPTDRSRDALAAAILASARPKLARLAAGQGAKKGVGGSGGAWWEWTARWGRAAIPIGIAAGIIGIAAAALLSLPSGDEAPQLRAPIVAFAAVASPAGSGAQLIDSLVGPATHEWLLSAAVQR